MDAALDAGILGAVLGFFIGKIVVLILDLAGIWDRLIDWSLDKWP